MLGLDAQAGAFGEGTFPVSPAGMASRLSVPVGTALYAFDDFWSGRARAALS